MPFITTVELNVAPPVTPSPPPAIFTLEARAATPETDNVEPRITAPETPNPDPILTFPETPTPPVTTTAPVVDDVEFVLLKKDIAPDTPNVPLTCNL